MMTVRRISYADIRNEPELLAEYTAECSNPQIGEINPDWEQYARLEAAGAMFLLGLYVDEELEGFATLMAYLNPHYSKRLAGVESLFVREEWRRKGGGIALIKSIEALARVEECVTILYSAPAGSVFEGFLMGAKGYQRVGSVFCKDLR